MSKYRCRKCGKRVPPKVKLCRECASKCQHVWQFAGVVTSKIGFAEELICAKCGSSKLVK